MNARAALNEYLFHELGMEGDESRLSETWPFALREIGEVAGHPVFEFDDDDGPYFAFVHPALNFLRKAGMALDDLVLQDLGSRWIAAGDPTDLSAPAPIPVLRSRSSKGCFSVESSVIWDCFAARTGLMRSSADSPSPGRFPSRFPMLLRGVVLRGASERGFGAAIRPADGGCRSLSHGKRGRAHKPMRCAACGRLPCLLPSWGRRVPHLRPAPAPGRRAAARAGRPARWATRAAPERPAPPERPARPARLSPLRGRPVRQARRERRARARARRI